MTVELHAAGLRKRFTGGAEVLKGVDVALRPGAPVAVVGERGSGKSTLIRCLAGTYRLDVGEITLQAADDELRIDTADARTRVWLRRAHVRVVDGALLAPPCDTPREIVARAQHLSAAVGGADDPAALLERLGLGGVADEPVGVLSAQARATLAVALQLLAPAAVWLLDDPLAAVWSHAEPLISELIAAAATSSAVLMTTTSAHAGHPLVAASHATKTLIDGVLT